MSQNQKFEGGAFGADLKTKWEIKTTK